MQGVLPSLFIAASKVPRIMSSLCKAPHGQLLHECMLSKDFHIKTSEIQFLEFSLAPKRVLRARVGLLDLPIILQIAPFPKSCRIHPFFEDDSHLQQLLPFLNVFLITDSLLILQYSERNPALDSVFLSTPFSYHHLEK